MERPLPKMWSLSTIQELEMYYIGIRVGASHAVHYKVDVHY